MGLKYIEPVKSVILVLLIILSVTLTFSIWTYSPKYETIEESPTVDVSIAEKREIDKIIKPYKALFHFEEGLLGTFESEEVDHIIGHIQEWTITNVRLVDTKLTEKKLNTVLRQPNHFTLFFHGEVPLPTYQSILGVEEVQFPEGSFDRLIVEWNQDNKSLQIHFISKAAGVHYSGEVKISDFQSFNREMLIRAKGYEDFVEVRPESNKFIAVPTNQVDLVRNIYYEDGILPIRFRDALFRDPNAVRRGQVTSTREEYQDDHAIMRIDPMMKLLTFIHPVAESEEIAIPSELLKKTIGFLNEHGGWTDEYRFISSNPETRNVKFQLFVNGLPVYSNVTSTEIEQTWGSDRIFRYVRPYYTLDLTLHSETRVVNLPSGVEVANTLEQSMVVDIDTVEEISLGYLMSYDMGISAEQRLLILEPSWFYLINGKWIPYSPKHLGGEAIGLE
ncbi:YycH family regulatory protein [Sporosarcina sp. CAU 1771]